jgi:hypothetical protein
MDSFIKQWIAETDCFLGLHDRKVCILGLCALLQSQNRPAAIEECSKEIMPSLILLFDGLKRAYAGNCWFLTCIWNEVSEKYEPFLFYFVKQQRRWKTLRLILRRKKKKRTVRSKVRRE